MFAAGHSRDPQFPVRPAGQEGQVPSSHLRQAGGQHAQRGRGGPHHHHGPSRQPDTGILRRKLLIKH